MHVGLDFSFPLYSMGTKLLHAVIILMGWMPFWMMYMLSDVLYIIVYRILGYRKEVVTKNLKIAFPEKSDAERKKIMDQFYRNFLDMSLESIKGFTIGEEELISRYTFAKSEYASFLKTDKQSVIAVAGHYTNWEWGVKITPPQVGAKKVVGIYKPIKNKAIEELTNSYRRLFGMNLVPTTETRLAFDEYVPKNGLFMMVADQSPTNVEKSYWTMFFNRPTMTLHGPEYYARKYKLPIVFLDIQRVKRGYYTVTPSLLVKDVSQFEDGVPTQMYMTKLEEIIKAKPEDWLWTHKRWKHNIEKYPNARVVGMETNS
jgi:KDO2-lipid IV(A) lauroyltransferase